MTKRPKRPSKMWIYKALKPLKSKVPDDLKVQVTEKAEELLEQWRPNHIKQPPEGYQYNYIVELYTNWIRSYFFFALNMPALALLPYHHSLNRVLRVWSTWAMGGSI